MKPLMSARVRSKGRGASAAASAAPVEVTDAETLGVVDAVDGAAGLEGETGSFLAMGGEAQPAMTRAMIASVIAVDGERVGGVKRRVSGWRTTT